MTETSTQSREVAHREAAQVPPSDGARMLQMVVDAAKDPAIDAGKMEQLVKLTTGLQDRERETEFNRSLVAAQLEMPVITRDGVITIAAKDGRPGRTQGRFARYEDIDRVIKPILAKYGLALRFEIGNAEHSAVTVRPILTHRNGYTLRGEAMKLPADKSGAKNDTQAVGSATQYGKRYTACGMLNIVTEGIDDDGNLGQTFVSLPYEREQLVRAEAQLAHEQGCYQEWFDRQPPKDRAWLVGSGLHEQYGGRALPARVPKPDGPKQPLRSRGAREETPDRTEEKRAKAQTPREWADLVKAELDKALDLDDLALFWDGKRQLLDRLKGAEPELWQELDDAYRLRRAQLEEGRLV